MGNEQRAPAAKYFWRAKSLKYFKIADVKKRKKHRLKQFLNRKQPEQNGNEKLENNKVWIFDTIFGKNFQENFSHRVEFCKLEFDGWWEWPPACIRRTRGTNSPETSFSISAPGMAKFLGPEIISVLQKQAIKFSTNLRIKVCLELLRIFSPQETQLLFVSFQ